MAAPTRVTGVSVALTTATTPKTTATTPKITAALNIAVGDIFVVCGGACGPSSGMGTNPSVSAGAVTWILQKSVSATGYGDLKLWSGTVTTASASATVSLTGTGGLSWGFVVEQYRNGTVGASVVNHASTGVPTIALTIGAANSAIVSGSTDFNASTGILPGPPSTVR
ncbi:hypothetical protein E5206_14210 [Arthrobacter sp. PAMC25564]|uniref:hypothetical protein n=1 Tax=Arthrobacter sp. PAMC25564 TaxID=2565366 RepID=UPI0010A24970|nr:hypothetical protein [Arthrobacter sp. PAMC25564]QCB97927.1 hypothetical protein E5206_14210 [Arthrobacter sp. PAMC25564]